MSNHLAIWDWNTLDNVLQMEGGYVLDFSDRTMANFFAKFRVDIAGPAYRDQGNSKAKRLRCFVRTGELPLVGQVLDALLDHRNASGQEGLDDDILGRYTAIAARFGGKGSSTTYAVSITRSHRLTVASSPEPTLDMTEYEHILKVCGDMAEVMERDPRAFEQMGEENLRSHFLVQLNGHYAASGETFNYEGKTDILIRYEGRVVFIGECKFWHGPAKFAETVDQLLGYAAWRDTKTAILLFSRNKDTSIVVAQIPGLLAAHSNFIRHVDYANETGFRAVLRHRDDPNRHLMLTVLVFDVPGERAKSSRALRPDSDG